MQYSKLILSWLMIAIIMSACAGSPPTPTATATLEQPTPSATATINWFPATATLTPFPTQPATPTPEVIPGLGALIFMDDFSQPELWSPNPYNTGNSIISNNLLTLTIPEGSTAGSVTILRNLPVISDFYARVQVQLGLCRGKDQFSFLFRVFSPSDFYRFSLTCVGELRLERVVSGKPFVIRDWTVSPEAPLGAPGEVKISVYAAGQDLKVFLNDHFQFSVDDHILNQGGFGFSIRSLSGDPMTVIFSKMIVNEVAAKTGTPAKPTSASPTPTH